MFKYFEIKLIKFYQKFISKQFGKNCKMIPTCSQYALIAINRFGFVKGNFFVFKRLLKCANKKSKNLDTVPYNIKGEFKWLI